MIREEFAGLGYPQRHALVAAEGATLTVYVPSEQGAAAHVVAPRSGIVGQPYAAPLVAGPAALVLIDFEGWVHGAAQYEHLDARGKWEAGVRHAAGRAFVEYPTIARRVVTPNLLEAVGTIAAAGDALTITNEAAVRRWLTQS